MASYLSRLSPAVNAPAAPAANQEPGTSIFTLRSTCCWPGYMYSLNMWPAMLFRGDTTFLAGGIAPASGSL